MKEDSSSEDTKVEFLVQSRLLYFDVCFRSYRNIAVSTSNGPLPLGETFERRHLGRFLQLNNTDIGARYCEILKWKIIRKWTA
jgi:hypothetical protein